MTTIIFRRLVITLVFLLFSPLSLSAGEFCQVFDSGMKGVCFPTLSSCEFAVKGGGGTCVFREASSTSSSSDPSGLAALGGLLKMMAEDERRKAREEQAQTERLEQQRRLSEQARSAQLQAERSEAQAKARDQAALDRLPEFGVICADLGFKTGSTAYSDCVVELYRRAKTQ
jgi:hypothetical protein